MRKENAGGYSEKPVQFLNMSQIILSNVKGMFEDDIPEHLPAENSLTI